MRTKRWILTALCVMLTLLAAAWLWPSTSAAPPVDSSPGDVNRDGLVNLLDLVAVSIRYGTQVPLGTPEDTNGDGRVDIFDLVVVATNLGSISSVPTPTAVPTQPPATWTPTATNTPTATQIATPTNTPTAPPLPTSTATPHPDPWCAAIQAHLRRMEQDHLERLRQLIASRDARGILEENQWYQSARQEWLDLYNLYCSP